MLTNAGRCGKIIKLSRGAARTLKIEQELTSKETLKFFESNSKDEWTKAKAKFVQKELFRHRELAARCLDKPINEEFDPGSGRTLAARLTHASRTERPVQKASAGRSGILVADG